jgi:hypothetical protein
LREADLRIRRHYELNARHVQAANSLWGAVLVQGVILAHLLRCRYSNIPLTETHPKALVRGWGRQNVEAIYDAIEPDVGFNSADEHRRDAFISAIAAREGFLGRWVEDLHLRLPPSERDGCLASLNPVHYFWPEKLDEP